MSAGSANAAILASDVCHSPSNAMQPDCAGMVHDLPLGFCCHIISGAVNEGDSTIIDGFIGLSDEVITNVNVFCAGMIIVVDHTKHIDIHYHFIRQMSQTINDNTITLVYCPTDDMALPNPYPSGRS